ncbi:MAG: hypothetical protein PVG21_06510 [Gammaproteobacteria bacterium]|jgi:uncharacterized membrane protein YagU involved in acid resistance
MRTIKGGKSALVVIGGGLAIAVIDALNAMAFWAIRADVPPQVILQSIAAGLLGPASLSGGATTAWLGAGLHLFMAICMAGVYCLAARRWPLMLERPAAFGLLYGVLTWLVMNYVVVPLSLAHAPPFQAAWFLDGLLVHLLVVGLGLAFLTRWAAGMLGDSIRSTPGA